MTDPTTTAPATVDADLRATIFDVLDDLMRPHEDDPDGGYWLCDVSADNLTERLAVALTAAGWPNSYVPGNPHVTAAREAREKLTSLVEGLGAIFDIATDRDEDLDLNWVGIVANHMQSARSDRRRHKDAVIRLDAAQAEVERLRAQVADYRKLDVVTVAKLRAGIKTIGNRLEEDADYGLDPLAVLADLDKLLDDTSPAIPTDQSSTDGQQDSTETQEGTDGH